MKKARIVIAIIAAIVMTGALTKLVQRSLPHAPIGGMRGQGQDLGSREHLLQVAEEMNQSMPRRIDEDTVVRSVRASVGELIYTVVSEEAPRPGFDPNAFIRTTAPGARSRACKDPQLTQLWRHGITVVYAYYGPAGRSVGEIVVTPRDCKR